MEILGEKMTELEVSAAGGSKGRGKEGPARTYY